jgi:homoserine kinase
LNFPEDLYCTVVCPLIKLPTKKMRKVLPKKISLQTAVKQWGNVAGLIAGLANKDFSLISRSLEDFIIEPKRSKFIPFFQQVKSQALASGALGCSISGSGPSIFALCQGRHSADRVAVSMTEIYKNKNISHKIYISSIKREGPKLC